MKVLIIKIFFSVLLLNFNIKISTGQRVSGGIGYFLNELDQQYKDPNFEYNKTLPFSVSFYFKNLYMSKFSYGLRFFYFRRDSRVINPSKENEYFKHGAKNVLSGLLINHRMKLRNNTLSMFYILNNSIGFAVRDIDQKSNINQGGDPGPSNPIRFAYVPGIEILHRLNDQLAVYGIIQYFLLLGSKKEIFPFSSVLSFEFGLSLSEKIIRKNK